MRYTLTPDLRVSVGKGTTFYSWLGVPSTASTSEIAKAYRRLSVQLQYVRFLLTEVLHHYVRPLAPTKIPESRKHMKDLRHSVL